MKKSKSMDDFLNAINSFKTGAYDTEDFILKVTELVNNGYLSEENINKLSAIINSSGFSNEVIEQLSNLVTNQETRLFTPLDSIHLNSDAKNSDQKSTSYSSSLLNELTQWNDTRQQEKVKPDQLIRGTYRLESKIGQGGMGEVWKAIDLIQDAGDSQDKYVAIKFLNQELKNHPDALKALVREFARYKKLIHPNIVRAYEINRDESAIFIAMEFLNGVSLKSFIQAHPNGISLAEAKPIIGGMCKALHYAHQEGIIHLDFKPGNVFYDEEHHTAKVIDFGIARLSNKEDRDKTRFDPGILGAVSTAYASTEMLLMDEEPDPRDDVYGLACVTYELLSGKHPFNRTIALKAEREKLILKPIKGLKDTEYQALLKGLKFRRNERTADPEQFFQDLYNSQKKTRKKNRYWLFIISVILVAILVIPTIFKMTYDAWKNDQLIKELNSNQESSFNEFLELSADKQHELLLEDSAKMTLVHHAINNYENKIEVIDFLINLNPKVQNLLFNNPQVSQLLITEFINYIDQALIDDNIDQALALTSKLIDKYPQSKLLSKKLETVINWKKNRLAVLEQTFYQCLNDTSKTILYLSPCFSEIFDHIKKLSPQRMQIYIPELSTRYEHEISSSIRENDYGLAEKLISNWTKMIPDTNNKRREFIDILEIRKLTFGLSEKINNDIETESAITELLLLDTKLKNKVLNYPGVKDKILNYFTQNIIDNLNSGDFSGAIKRYETAYNIFSEIPNGKIAVTLLYEEIQKQKTLFINKMNERYYSILATEMPDITKLKAVTEEIKSVDQNNILLQYPDIPEIFSKKINHAISNEDYDSARELLQNWTKLRPGDINSKELVKLYKRLNEQLENFSNRVRINNHIQNAINSEQILEVNKVLKELKAQYSEEDIKHILSNFEKPLISFYQEQIQIAMNKDAFSSAYAIADEALILFPKSLSLFEIIDDIKKAQSKRISFLKTAFKDSLKSNKLNEKEIFSHLLTLRSIDENYLDKDPSIYKNLESQLLELADQEDKFDTLQDLMVEWEKFFNGGSSTPLTQKNYLKSKNLIALRCLYTGQRLKNAGKYESSSNFIIFGLTLNPIKTVRRALEKELLR